MFVDFRLPPLKPIHLCFGLLNDELCFQMSWPSEVCNNLSSRCRVLRAELTERHSSQGVQLISWKKGVFGWE